MNPLFVQFLRFSGVGVLGTSVHYVILVILVQGWVIDAVISSTAGFMAGALTNYVLNYHYTFASNKHHGQAIIRFFGIAMVGMIFNGLIMSLLTDTLMLHYLLAQVLATGLVLMWNFTANRWWTFRECEVKPDGNLRK